LKLPIGRRVTVLAYTALAPYVFCLYGLGPILVFLHDELRLSYTLTSLHSALWAAGTVLSGLVFARLTRLAGRVRLFWWSMAGTAAGALLFAVGHIVALTLLAAGSYLSRRP
jgi:MFS family permease